MPRAQALVGLQGTGPCQAVARDCPRHGLDGRAEPAGRWPRLVQAAKKSRTSASNSSALETRNVGSIGDTTLRRRDLGGVTIGSGEDVRLILVATRMRVGHRMSAGDPSAFPPAGLLIPGEVVSRRRAAASRRRGHEHPSQRPVGTARGHRARSEGQVTAPSRSTASSSASSRSCFLDLRCAFQHRVSASTGRAPTHARGR